MILRLNTATLAAHAKETWSFLSADLFSLVGVLYLHWGLAGLVALFCVETTAICIVNLLKIIIVGITRRTLFMIPALIVIIYYGAAGAAYWGIILRGENAAPFTAQAGTSVILQWYQEIAHAIAGNPGLLAGVIICLANQLWLYCRNFILKKEYRTASLLPLALGPYFRFWGLGMLIFLYASLRDTTGSAETALVILALLKTGFDLFLHYYAKKNFSFKPEAA